MQIRETPTNMEKRLDGDFANRSSSAVAWLPSPKRASIKRPRKTPLSLSAPITLLSLLPASYYSCYYERTFIHAK